MIAYQMFTFFQKITFICGYKGLLKKYGIHSFFSFTPFVFYVLVLHKFYIENTSHVRRQILADCFRFFPGNLSIAASSNFF